MKKPIEETIFEMSWEEIAHVLATVVVATAAYLIGRKDARREQARQMHLIVDRLERLEDRKSERATPEKERVEWFGIQPVGEETADGE